jgi:hypothetical protein
MVSRVGRRLIIDKLSSPHSCTISLYSYNTSPPKE